MNKETISRRYDWTKRTFTVFAVLLVVGSTIEATGIRLPLDLAVYGGALIVASLLAFTIALGSFARSLDESATSWIGTVVLIPVVGIILAYLHLGRKYERAMRQDQDA